MGWAGGSKREQLLFGKPCVIKNIAKGTWMENYCEAIEYNRKTATRVKRHSSLWKKKRRSKMKKVKWWLSCTRADRIKWDNKYVNLPQCHLFLKSNCGSNCWIELNSSKAHSTSTEVADINVWFGYLKTKDTHKY